MEKLVLFYAFLVVFMASAAVTLLGITNAVKVKPVFLKALFAALLLELVSAVITLYKDAAFFKPQTVTRYYPATGESDLQSFKAVERFYECVQNDKAALAWDILSERYIKANKLCRELFVDGYKNTVRIHLLAVLPRVTIESEPYHEYIVYYTDEVCNPVFSELNGLNSFRLSQLPLLTERLASLKERVAANGFLTKTIDELTLQQLIAPNSGDIVRFLLKRDSGKDSDSLFEERRSVKYISGFLVGIRKYGEDWKIDSITPLNKAIGLSGSW